MLSYLLSVPKNAPDKAAALCFVNDTIRAQKQITAADKGYLPLTDNVSLHDQINSQLTLPMDEGTRETGHLTGTSSPRTGRAIRLVEQVVDAAGR